MYLWVDWSRAAEPEGIVRSCDPPRNTVVFGQRAYQPRCGAIDALLYWPRPLIVPRQEGKMNNTPHRAASPLPRFLDRWEAP